jgi:hypothetical protein
MMEDAAEQYLSYKLIEVEREAAQAPTVVELGANDAGRSPVA